MGRQDRSHGDTRGDVSLTGWQAIAALLIAAGVAVVGVLVPGGTVLVALSSSMVTGVFALLQPRRDPTSRTRSGDRSGDRSTTAAQGIAAYDPHKTPREGTQPMPPRDRRP
jgi:hypothetical protein